MACLLGCSLVAQAAYQGHVYVDANRNGRYDKMTKVRNCCKASVCPTG